MAGLTREQLAERKAAAINQQTTETLSKDESFSNVKGAPAVEHQKKIQRQLKAEKKIVKPSKQFYTVKDGKVLSVTVKANGAYSTYIGTKNKMEKKAKGSYFTQVKLWQKAGQWVSEEDYQEHCEDVRSKLAKG